MDLIGKGDVQGRSPRSVASFLQVWLFFGLISEVLGISVDSSPASDFVRSNDWDRKYIDTNSLRTWFARTIKDYSVVEDDQGSSQFRQIQGIKAGLASADARLLISKQLATRPGATSSIAYGQDDDLMPLLTLSLIVIGETLTWFRDRHLFPGDPIPGWTDLGSEPWGDSELLIQAMKAEGWCPSSIDYLQKLLRNQTSGLYYASTFKVPSDINGIRGSADRHRSCSIDDCKAEADLVESSRMTGSQHVSSGCECRLIGPSMKEIISILRASEFYPLLRLQMDKSKPESARIEVIPCKADTTYVAISHVRVDGLGNPAANMLPLCQVRRIQDLCTGSTA